MARTSDEKLFNTKKDPYAFVKKQPKAGGKVGGEIKKHKTISLRIVDKLLLFASNRGVFPPKSCWNKRRPLTRLYDETRFRMDEMLDVSKILKDIRATKILLEHGFLS